ncbi:methyltransferase domain-containing protein [Frankia sp. AiPs1]|uniref:class I SAM-dependent methyltransferase n=1 Tax=Frankia sp. AiPs1 TaxID=573493 RepID=UPI0020432E70|nr:class I SAM-dependent methyltransferase [Frankia sp. AiPs1]MCM3923773.1 methyltransferase domain-containing protein [Frankia sp. AiPs1]
MTDTAPARRRRYADDVLGGPTDTERARLAAMAAVCDPTTIRVLGDRGVGVGWRCLEVGAGGGSIAAWLADRVTGADANSTTEAGAGHGAGSGSGVGSGVGAGHASGAGHVVATDVDTRHLDVLAGPDLTVLRHDVTRDPAPPGGPFDLIHTRFVLEHLPDREQVLDRLRDWLAPAGVLVVESIVGFPLDSSPHPPFRQAMRSIDEVLAKTIGTDSAWARGFPTPLQARGLIDVGLSVHLPTTGGANASAQCWALTLTRLRPHIRELDLASDDLLDEALAALADPAFFDLSFATAIAWGRAPG